MEPVQINFNFASTPDVISKVILWRVAIREVKSRLCDGGYRNITFNNYLDFDRKIILVKEGKYQVTDEVDFMNSNNKKFKKVFNVNLSIIGQGESLNCKVDSLEIMEDNFNGF